MRFPWLTLYNTNLIQHPNLYTYMRARVLIHKLVIIVQLHKPLDKRIPKPRGRVGGVTDSLGFG